jgi:hypothetical protein
MLAALRTALDVTMTFKENVIILQPRHIGTRKVPPKDIDRQLLLPQFEREVGRK